ncbi:hypothetical protein JD76_05126 [Micromonospora endolithica]|nr:hypothetical protein JD76_05126 [Micromonospora endolithica]
MLTVARGQSDRDLRQMTSTVGDASVREEEPKPVAGIRRQGVERIVPKGVDHLPKYDATADQKATHTRFCQTEHLRDRTHGQSLGVPLDGFRTFRLSQFCDGARGRPVGGEGHGWPVC